MSEYFKRDPAGVPYEVRQIMARKLFANLRQEETDNALGHSEVGNESPDIGGDSTSGVGDRRRHVVNVVSKLFAVHEVEE